MGESSDTHIMEASVKSRPWDFLLSNEQRQALAALMIVEDKERRTWGPRIIDLTSDENHKENLEFCFKALARKIRKNRERVEKGITEAYHSEKWSNEGSPMLFVYTLIAEEISYLVNEMSDGSQFVVFGNTVLSRLHCTAVVEILKMLKPSSPDYAKWSNELKIAHKCDFESLGWSK